MGLTCDFKKDVSQITLKCKNFILNVNIGGIDLRFYIVMLLLSITIGCFVAKVLLDDSTS